MSQHFVFLLLLACITGCTVDEKQSDDGNLADASDSSSTNTMSSIAGGETQPASDCRNAVLECAAGFRCVRNSEGLFECTEAEVSEEIDNVSDLGGVPVTDVTETPESSAGSAGNDDDEPSRPPRQTSGPMADRGKSFKRGIASALTSVRDLEVLSPGVSWWYNWSPRYNDAVSDVYAQYDMDWVPMTWNGNNPDEVRAFLDEHPNVRYLLTFNEPNFQDQANLTPEYAASIWPTFEAIAEEYDIELVGPAVNFCGGCVLVDGMPIGSNYVIWLDMFFDSFRSQFGREPRMEYTALHWYDFGLEDQVNEIVTRYGKPGWVTEFALWRSEDWNTDEHERNWLVEMVNYLENNPMVYRYAWFTGRRPDFSRINLLGGDGELTPLGQAYVDAPY